jgi:hypothetical protein
MAKSAILAGFPFVIGFVIGEEALAFGPSHAIVPAKPAAGDTPYGHDADDPNAANGIRPAKGAARLSSSRSS